MKVVSFSSRSVSLAWDPILCHLRNGPITGYTVVYNISVQGTAMVGNVTNTEGTSVSLDDLVPYTTYIYRVAGVNSAGTGEFTADNSNNNFTTEEAGD